MNSYNPIYALLLFFAILFLVYLLFRPRKGWFWLIKNNLKSNEKIVTEDVLKQFNCKPTELPLIFVSDPAIMGLGVKPGDMIKITRKSATAGESTYYRYVVEI